MPKTSQFDRDPLRYDGWFDKHNAVFESELNALKAFLPQGGMGVEIGLGTGRFSRALGVDIGVEPSEKLRELARKKGVDAVEGSAEALPFMPNWFSYALMINVLCFVDDPEAALNEARRVLRPDGVLLLAIIPKDSPLGREYGSKRGEDDFYRDARFFTVEEAVELLKKTGFADLAFVQTVFKDIAEIIEPEPVKEGFGEGSFVVIRARKAVKA